MGLQMQIKKWIFSVFANYTVVNASNIDAHTTTSLTSMQNMNDQLVNSNNIMSLPEKTAILNLINKRRGTVNPPPCALPYVTWGEPLQAALEKYVADNGGAKLFSEDHGFPPEAVVPYHKNNWLMYHLMEIPEFAPWKNTTVYLTHDTQSNKYMAVYGIFRFREMQTVCFSWSHCNNITYSNFDSCIPDNLRNKKRNGQSLCGYACEFDMRLLLPFSEIACMKTGVPGPYTPINQPNGFVCYASAAKALVFNNDIPYQKCATRAVECPSGSYQGLCKNIGASNPLLIG
jgi:hypothetical protein